MAGTPSMDGGASERPSVSERWERASEAAVSAVEEREVGTGGSVAGKEGRTVRWAVDGVEEGDGFGAVLLVDAAGLAGVVFVLVVAAAFAGVAHAERRVDVANVRCDNLCADDDALDDDDDTKAEKPLLADAIVMVRTANCMQKYVARRCEDLGDIASTRSHDFVPTGLCCGRPIASLLFTITPPRQAWLRGQNTHPSTDASISAATSSYIRPQ